MAAASSDDAEPAQSAPYAEGIGSHWPVIDLATARDTIGYRVETRSPGEPIGEGAGGDPGNGRGMTARLYVSAHG
jgi:hypothetical protein